MNFLHLLSSEAVHTITIHCLNIPVWETKELGAQKSSIGFKGWNGQMFEANTLLEPKVLLDECMVNHLLVLLKYVMIVVFSLELIYIQPLNFDFSHFHLYSKINPFIYMGFT